MKMHAVYRYKREALGLSQRDVAELAEVSHSSVSNFENGGDISIPYYHAIIRAIDDEYAKLNKTDFLITMLTKDALSLSDPRLEDKVKTLTYMQMNIAKLQLELMKED